LHSIEVARKALEIASRVKIDIDRALIARGAVFHDLGKTKTYGLQHGADEKMAEQRFVEILHGYQK